MANIVLDVPRPLPRWLVVAGSVAVVGHLLIIAFWAVGAPSGPWLTPVGSTLVDGPKFAEAINQNVGAPYLRTLRMTHTYRFMSDRVPQAGVYFEVRLKDDKGSKVKTLKFPDPSANAWVRHRQQLLAMGLLNDIPVNPEGELIPGGGKQIPTTTVWLRDKETSELRLQRVPQHLVPREPDVMRPSEWSHELAKSYARYLCRTHGAASAEVVRHSREAVLPIHLFVPGSMPPNLFEELVCNFGEMRRD